MVISSGDAGACQPCGPFGDQTMVGLPRLGLVVTSQVTALAREVGVSLSGGYVDAKRGDFRGLEYDMGRLHGEWVVLPTAVLGSGRSVAWTGLRN